MNDNLKRKNDETLEEYQIRLSLGLLNKEVGFEDTEWEDIKELLNSSKHRDTLRREGYGIRIYDDYIKSKTSEMITDEAYQRLIDKELQLKEKEVKIRDMNNALNKKIRENARKDSLGEILEEKMEELKTSKPFMNNENFTFTPSSGRDGVMFISDIHMGSEVDNILDKYNPKICKEKMFYYVEKVIQYGKENNIDKLYILIGGDIVSGIIHDTNRYESRLNIVEQITEASEMLSEAISILSNHFYCICGLVLGNHDRIVAQKDKSLENENFAILIDKFIKFRLANNSRVVFLEREDEGILEFDVKGHKCLCVHGHCDRDNTLDRLIEMFNYKPEFIFKGHDHKARMFEKNRTTIICNGAFSGEEYSKNARLYNKSIQMFSIFDEDGMICNYFINLNDYITNN